MNQPVLQIDRASQTYGNHPVVRNLSLTLEEGTIGCLLGESGCGKTTVLRTIAGFEPLLDGEIRIDGEPVSRRGWSLPPERRAVGFVFQDYALFPHLTVFENVAFGLRQVGRSTRVLRVNEMLETIGLADTRDRYPHELSGGQQQRIALARALAPRPRLLLMDEPFSNLDVALREKLSTEVREVLKRDRTTALLVTHNQHEAFAVADRVGVMQGGEIRQWAPPHELYHRPADPYVADFVGEGSLLRGVVQADGQVATDLGVLGKSGTADHAPGDVVRVLVRPEDVIHEDASTVRAEVLRQTFRGANTLYALRLAGGGRVLALVPSHCQHQPGEAIGIRSDVRHLVLFSEGTP